MVLLGVMVGLLAACGGGDDDTDTDDTEPAGDETPALAPTPTDESPPAAPTPTLNPDLRPAAPRSLPRPEGDPAEFAPPATVGDFQLQPATQGRPTAPTGLRAEYRAGDLVAYLNVYYFDTPETARDNVYFSLNQPSVDRAAGMLYYDLENTAAAFGMAPLNRAQGSIATWSHYHWFFKVQTTGDLDSVNAFLDAFPY
ncbi:MAG: hypothetical protein GYB65_02890 [Chloroflexi bacterium]|nr:hypothetical protein [Chloroflexota bacterium]